MSSLIKLMVFDVDGTLAIGQRSIENKIAQIICQFEKSGIKICFASGKDQYYLSALSRGMGLERPFYIAENGGVLVIDEEKHIEVIERDRKELNYIKELIIKEFDKVWIQPNEACITVIAKDNSRIEEIYTYLQKNLPPQKYNIYIHYLPDCSSIDVLPKTVDKAIGLKFIMNKFKFSSNEIIVAGDSLSDLHMAKYSDLMLVVGDKLPYIHNAMCFETPMEMINFLYNIIFE